MTEPTGLAILFPELDTATTTIRSAFAPAHAQGADLPFSDLPVPALPLAARADAVGHLALREGRWYEFARYPLAATGDAR